MLFLAGRDNVLSAIQSAAALVLPAGCPAPFAASTDRDFRRHEQGLGPRIRRATALLNLVQLFSRKFATAHAANISANFRLAALALAGALLAGCAAGPDYVRAELAIPAHWQARLPHGGKVSDLVSWWSAFHDSALAELIESAESNSPSLASAAARIEKARGTFASAASGFFPSVTGNGSVTRASTQSGGATMVATTSTTGLDASWEIDLFGKVRRQTEASAARVEAAVADWHDGRISLAAETADDYVQYKACRALVRLYRAELASQQATVRATRLAAETGQTATADLALAEAGAASAASTLIDQEAQCDILVKSMTVLTGMAEGDLRRLADKSGDRIPKPAALAVTAVPADLLSQRPDIVSLERELAAKSAEIGAAEADRYPSVSLSGAISITQMTGAAAYAPWSFGPALSAPLFDAGKRKAAVDVAEASYRDALAAYEKGVRNAVGEVEKALVRLDATRRRVARARIAAVNYRSYFNSTDKNWRSGGISLLSLEEARRSARSAETTLVGLERDQVQYWIALYKALGGGWRAAATSKDFVQNFKRQRRQ
jgi:outer membrane protein, multidrug efflux system